MLFFFFKQKSAYEMRISDWSSDVCSSDLIARELSQRWDAFGRLINSTDGRGAVTSYDYDRLGRQVAQRQTVSGRVEQAQTRYDAWSRITAPTDALGHTTTYRFDDATRSVTVTTPEQVVMRTRHNRHVERQQQRLVGQECHSTCRSRGSPHPKTKKN